MGSEQRGETPVSEPTAQTETAERKIEVDISGNDGGPAVKIDLDVIELAGVPVQVIPHPDIENGKAILVGPLFLALPLDPSESLPALLSGLRGGVTVYGLDDLKT